ncbi:MAG: DNA-directed RNA polymerase subunit beta' [Eubacteriaceae bacterium]|nr:DNA-directed RNA polymerase subunit beta' [Eubacteriaceae bacterium]
MSELKNFKAIKIGLASADRIREWSFGEVKKPETINYRTSKPEKDGLFCEKIFGPTKDWECYCGKYKQIKNKSVICDRCGVEVTRSKVRRERMGHIELAAPVTHIWYFRGIPSRIGIILDISPKELEKIIYFAAYIVTNPGNSPLAYKQILTEQEYASHKAKNYGEGFKAGIGAEAILELLQQLDLQKEFEELKKTVADATGQKKVKSVRKLEIVEAFLTSGNKPEDMVLTAVPVIPPDLRPMVTLDGGRYATSDMNDLYRRVINRNNRLQKLLELHAPDIIIQNEKRMLQEAVDALIDNGRRGRPVTGPGNRPLRSLSDMLKGKQGRFRQNLLGKRVDYSGRSVIVVGPELKMYQCGLPKEMAIELFKPFVMRELVARKYAQNIKSAKRMVERQHPEVFDILDDVIKDHPVLLNRAPTLHRLGIQAFEPVLVEGRALKLHPLVCTAYNADFDGDQMAIHVPLSVEAQAEARILMLAAYNILKPQDGSPVCTPTQDMILGSYYLTIERDDAKGIGKVFSDIEEMEMAYFNKEVDLHARVKVRVTKEIGGVMKSRLVESTVGRFIFNQIIPQEGLGFVKRETEEDMFRLEVDRVVDKGMLTNIVYQCFLAYGAAKTSQVLDDIKSTGFKYSTISATSIGILDMEVPEKKADILAQAEKDVNKIYKEFTRGLYTDDERRKKTIDVWTKATDDVTSALMSNLNPKNPINMMADSGARGSKNQIRQLAGMRGLMASPSGDIIELPIKANFREGLDVLEFFISSHGARKGLSDTALRTSESGYLTRRLVDVSQDQIIREDNCGTPNGFEVEDIVNGGDVIETLEERIRGRYAFEDIADENGELIVGKDELIDIQTAKKIVGAGYKKIKIRTVFNCASRVGVCRKCYGIDLTTMQPVNIGEAVGTIAAQSIGEPGTQLTMRTFHTGGVAGADDITQGLPRVEELFESRRPKGVATLTEISGEVRMTESKKKIRQVDIIARDATGLPTDIRSYEIPAGETLLVGEGDYVEAGDQLTKGSISPSELMNIKGADAVQRYILSEVQKVYRLQGVHIGDKHIEIIIRQMLRKFRVDDSGDTNLITGALVDKVELEVANEKALAEGKTPASATGTLLGITKASLATSSFLSAASFQETTRVLADAAIKGKVDPLVGLKENIIIGKLIPAGTGIDSYTDILVNVDRPEKPQADDDDDQVFDGTEDMFEDDDDIFEDFDVVDDYDHLNGDDEDDYEDEDDDFDDDFGVEFEDDEE